MAYLNFQIEHHLFPSMPQYRHPQVALRFTLPQPQP
jgi:fatty acid desaturase